MKKIVLYTCLFFSINVYSQQPSTHKVKIEIGINALMCPNLSMKINRTFIQRNKELSDWKVATDNNSALFLISNPLLCNKDSILKIFVKESEYPLHIIQSIQIDDLEVYKKENNN
jgi:hypothetical protein